MRAALLAGVLLAGCSGERAPVSGADAEPGPPARTEEPAPTEEHAPTEEPAEEAPPPALDWAEVVQARPDPEQVPDDAYRRRIAETGLPWHVREPASGIELLLVPPGEYVRGASDDDEHALDDERPRHTVRVEQPFYLGRCEVTQEQWTRVMEDGAAGLFPGARRPAESLDAFTIQGFLARTGLQLPTEAQWEVACRGGVLEPRYGPLEEVAWCRGNARGTTHAVGGKRPNAYGFHDMLGNVWEWTRSDYVADEYARYAERGVAAAYARRSGAGKVVLRGGSYFDAEKRLRASARYAVEGTLRASHIGFRVARRP